MRLLQLFSLHLFVLISHSVQSAVIEYSELGGDGSISNHYYSPTDLGAADIGMNSISGQVSFSYDSWGLISYNHDYSIFSVPEGMQIDSMIFGNLGGTRNIGVGVRLHRVNQYGNHQETIATFNVDPLSSYTTPEYTDVLQLAGLDSLETGYYRLSTFEMRTEGFGAFTYGYMNYNWNFNITSVPTPVPVPASIWLTISGLLGLYGAGKKRNALASHSKNN